MLKSSGSIVYRHNWWVWIQCDPQLGKYLRKLYRLARRNVDKLGQPSQGEHITVVSREEKNDNFERLWKRHEGKSVEFELILNPQTNGNAFWFPVMSKDVENFRIELGLQAKRIPEIHFCCGYLRQGKSYESRLLGSSN